MSFIILTAVLSCLNSAFYICSRVLFILAEQGHAFSGGGVSLQRELLLAEGVERRCRRVESRHLQRLGLRQ